MTMSDAAAPRGLKGVIVADTALGDVRGLEGFYHYRQYSAPELAATRTFEDVWYLLFEGRAAVPRRARPVRGGDRGRCARSRRSLLELLPAIARGATPPLGALRTALSQLAAIENMPPTYDADPATIRANAMRLCRGDARARRRAVPRIDRARADRAAP